VLLFVLFFGVFLTPFSSPLPAFPGQISVSTFFLVPMFYVPPFLASNFQ